MFARPLQKIALVVVTAAACSTPPRSSAKDASVARARADTSLVTTHEMAEALSRDVKNSDRDLTAAEDSMYVFMGDSVSLLLKQAHASWERYRKLECDAIRVAFAEGSMAPVAQMECWIDLTDDHRKFIDEQYGYMRNGRTAQRKPAR